jgi:hypothetical protein
MVKKLLEEEANIESIFRFKNEELTVEKKMLNKELLKGNNSLIQFM